MHLRGVTFEPQVNCSQVEWLHSSVDATGNPEVAGSNFVEVLLMSAPLNKLRWQVDSLTSFLYPSLCMPFNAQRALNLSSSTSNCYITGY